MSEQFDLSGTFYGSVFVKCNFAGPPPAWAVAEDRIRAGIALLEQMPVDLQHLPPPGRLAQGSWVPHAPNPLFVGRAGELQAVAAALKGKDGAASLCPPVGLAGIGGVGKTQAAIEFAHRLGPWFLGGVFWLDCADPASIDSQIARLGAEAALEAPQNFADLKLDEQCQVVLRLWNSPLPRLLIFDNIEDDGLLGLLRPKQGGCRILATSRRSVWSAAHGVIPVAVEPLPRQESVRLLEQFRPDLAAKRAAMEAVAAELDDLPLALHLAGAFMRENRHDPTGEPSRYLQALQDKGLDEPSLTGTLGASGVQDISPTGHERHVARTFALSWGRLDLAVPVDALARQLLCCAAWLAPRVAIPRSVLESAVQPSMADDAPSVGQALARLTALGLVTEEAEEPLLHRLVAAFVRSRDVDAAAYRDAVEFALWDALQSANEAFLLQAGRRLIPHVEHHLGTMAHSDQSARVAAFLYELGTYEELAGDGCKAMMRFERVVAMQDAEGDTDDAVSTDGRWIAATAGWYDLTTMALGRLGSVLRERGEYRAAIPVFERAIAESRAKFGQDHPRLAQSIRDLATVQYELNDIFTAERNLRDALKIVESKSGSLCFQSGVIYSSLGLVVGHYDLKQSFEYLNTALAIHESYLEPTDPRLAVDLSNLASVLRKGSRRNRVRARELVDQAVAIAETVFGADHPITLRYRGNLRGLPSPVGERNGSWFRGLLGGRKG